MTLEDMLKDVGSYVDQDDTTPTDTDLAIRTRFMNFALREWAMSYDWDELKSSYRFTTTLASQATISLPTNFKKPCGALSYYNTQTTLPEQYELIPLEETINRFTTDNFGYILGNEADGYNIIVPKSFPSGASLALPYYRYPASLATLTDVAEMRNPNYLVQRTIAFVLEGRGDPRYQRAEEKATVILQSSIENQNTLRISGGENRVSDYYTKRGFRIGRR